MNMKHTLEQIKNLQSEVIVKTEKISEMEVELELIKQQWQWGHARDKSAPWDEKQVTSISAKNEAL